MSKTTKIPPVSRHHFSWPLDLQKLLSEIGALQPHGRTQGTQPKEPLMETLSGGNG